MLAALLIAFREAIEAGLVIGIVLATTRGVAGRGRAVTGGLLAGLAGSVTLAACADAVYDAFSGYGQDILNASILLAAVAMLAWHNSWMAAHSRTIAAEIRAVGQEVAAGRSSLIALFMIVFLAVLREGSEIALFFYGILLSGEATALSMLIGGALGLAGGGALAAALYYGLTRIPTHRLFAATSAMIILLAAGLASKAMFFLQQYGLGAGLREPLWDTSAILSQESPLGGALVTLIGYSDQPNALQATAYVATLLVMGGLTWLFRRGAPLPRRA